MGAARGAGGSPTGPDLPPHRFAEGGEDVLSPPRVLGAGTPSPAAGFGGPAPQPSARCSRGTARGAWGWAGTQAGTQAGMQAAPTTAPAACPVPTGRGGLCGATPRPPLHQWEPPWPLPPVPRALRSEAPRAPGPPNSPPGRPAPAAVGALLFSDTTLERKQLRSSSPSR